MAIIEVSKRSDWQELSSTSSPFAFLQSWDFGTFLSSIGRNVKRWSDSDNPQFQVQGIINKYYFGSFVYLPHASISPEFLMSLVRHFRNEKFTFIRIEPVKNIFPDNLAYTKVTNRQAQHHWVLDTTQPIEKILAGMHAKTRYNIRLAEKKGVTIREEKNPALFLDLETRTAFRKGGFDSPQDISYYSELLKNEASIQSTAYYNNTAVASSILLYHNQVLTYLFGGSDNTYRAIMAPTMLQWYNINLTKRLNGRAYNFLGVAPEIQSENEPSDTFHGYTWNTIHPYSVLTRFKAGFGGKVHNFGQAIDVILAPKSYKIMCGMDKFFKSLK